MSRRRLAVLVSVALLATAPGALAAPGEETPPGGQGSSGNELPEGDEQALLRLELPDRGMLEDLVADGADLTGRPTSGPDAQDGVVLVDVVLSGDELAALQADGATVRQVIQREGDAQERFEASRVASEQRRATGLTEQTLDGENRPADTLEIDYAAWWEQDGQTFLQVQATTSAVLDPELEIDVEWETAAGETGSFPLVRYVDAGQYLFHYQVPEPLPAAPVAVTATSSEGGTASADPTPWPGEEGPELPDGYQSDFIDRYLTPGEIDERIDRLAAQYPDLVDVVELPNQTLGYRRTAKALVGDPATGAVVVESEDYGVEGPNGTEVVVVDPGQPDQELAGAYDAASQTLTLTLATDGDGAVVSTTDEVAAFVNAQFPALFTAFVPEGSAGLVMPAVESAVLDDGLDASHLNPEGQTVRMMRIGKHRDGTRPGVFAYSQEHAREWVTPLATMEFAERMLANANTDEETGQLLEDVEIFVLPVVNPDGANYSFYDFGFQRKNLSDHCQGVNRDPRYEDSWGTDINRNYAVGSVFDGYVGGSLNCRSGTFAGTGELSEPESRNVVAVADQYPSITHAMNVHSFGGYFMWSPGAYRMPGREPLPVPPPDVEADFVDASRRVVAAIAVYRDTVTWPSKTGPVVDVLYSAAGNSGDHLYYENDIYAWDFEVGNDLWDEQAQEWVGVGFQPPFAEAHPESQEYAAGLVELVRVAADADSRVTRLGGDDRYDTAVAIGQEAFPDSTAVTIVSGAEANLVDGLVAAPLAHGLGQPLLATQPDELPEVVLADLAGRGVTEAFVVGGTTAVNGSVVEQLADLGIEVTRVSGDDRWETAVEVAELVGGDEAVVASGQEGNLVDALAVAGPAADAETPILLVQQGRIPGATAGWLTGVDSTVVTGGTDAVSEAVLQQLPDPVRVAGGNRWQTAAAVADYYVAAGLDAESVTVASGEEGHLVDALAGGVLGEPILLTRVNTLPNASTAWVADHDDTSRAYVLGGTSAVAEAVVETLEELLADR